MRFALVRNVLAATSMVALAFVIPLGLLAKQIAHDRALSDARQQAAVVVAAMAAAGDDRPALERALAVTPDVAEQVVVFPPDGPPVGDSRAEPDDVALVQDQARSLHADAEDGVVLLQPVVVESGTAVVEVYVSDAELWQGVWPAWLAMGGLAVTLVAGSVALADRLGTRVVAAARSLGRAARSFGAQDFSARVSPDGPTELAEAGQAFNAMAGRLVAMIDAERERAADMSHRLRTPLTALRLEAEALPPGDAAYRIRDSLHVLEAEVDSIITSARRPVADVDSEATDLVDVLAARLAFWTVLAEHQERSWQVLGDDDPIWLDVPRAELTAAIDALISNVFRHTQPRTPFQVTVGQAALVVEDGGPGIADVESAIQRGISGADSTGLGLDIVQAVAARAGGRVDVDNGVLGGARITVRFTPSPGS